MTTTFEYQEQKAAHVFDADPDAKWCGLTDDMFKQCCCNCTHHLSVNYHCCTEPNPNERYKGMQCVCGVQKGWACVCPEMGKLYDNWPEHSVGCELYNPKCEKELE